MKLATMGTRFGKPGWPLRLDHREGLLIISGRGATGSAPATGTWPGGVLIDAAAVGQLHPRLPTADPLIVTAREGWLSIGSFSMPAEVLDEGAPALVDTTTASGDRDILIAYRRHGEAHAAATFGRAALDRALVAADRAANAALRSLRPYGVKKAEIRGILNSALDR